MNKQGVEGCVISVTDKGGVVGLLGEDMRWDEGWSIVMLIMR